MFPRPQLASLFVALALPLGCSFAAGEAGSGASSNQLTGEAGSESGDEQGQSSTQGEAGDSSSALDMMPSACDAPCDPFDAEACPEGSKCVPATCEPASAGFDSHMCRPVSGDQQAGETCLAEGREGIDDCAQGLVCWGVDPGTGEGHCEPLCVGSAEAPQCEAGRVCSTFGAAKIALCVSRCNPLEQDCPIEGNACLPLSSAATFACLPGAADGGLGYGEPCEFANACEPGAMCIDGIGVPAVGCDEAQDCCSPLCDLLDPQGVCPGEGQSCAPLDAGLNVDEDYPDVGVCTAV